MSSHEMSSHGIVCGACSWPLPEDLRTREEGKTCPVCHAPVVVRIFPAFVQSKAGSVPQPLGEATEANCFYHPRNRAATPCDECGRFLCDLCTLEIPGAKLCPVCFASNVHGRKPRNLETSRTLHDSIALTLATAPAVMVWPIVVTAPLSLFWVFRHWKSPGSILPRTRWRFYLAGVFAVTEIALVVAGIVAIRMVRR